MTGLYFVDANVLVYALDPRDPVKRQRAIVWRDYLWRERIGRTSIQALSEAYATLKRLGGATADDLWENVSQYLAWDPVPVDATLLRRGREVEQRWRLSWWDSLIVGAAQLQDCAWLLTEDLQDGAVFGTVKVRSPFTLSVEGPAATYSAALPIASLHRPRGRPRRAATV